MPPHTWQEVAIAEIRQQAREQALSGRLSRLATAESAAHRRAEELAEARGERRLNRAWLSGALSPARGLRRRARLVPRARDGGVEEVAQRLSRLPPDTSECVAIVVDSAGLRVGGLRVMFALCYLFCPVVFVLRLFCALHVPLTPRASSGLYAMHVMHAPSWLHPPGTRKLTAKRKPWKMSWSSTAPSCLGPQHCVTGSHQLHHGSWRQQQQ